MIGLVFQKRFACVCDANKFCREIREKKFQQISSRKVLQAFVRMRDLSLQRDLAKKKSFLLFYLPDCQLRVSVNILLKKNRHESKFHDYFASPIEIIDKYRVSE